MTRKEIIEFLELPESVSEHTIVERLKDKAVYFKRLQENAPNDFLRKLHLQNIEKVKVLQEQYGVLVDEFDEYNEARNDKKSVGSGLKSPVAWLIRHTENLPVKQFPLLLGENPLGREPQFAKTGVYIENDDYVSRRHAVVYVENNSGYKFFIEDNASANSGKPSKNGTYINGAEKRIAERTLIQNNDTIQVGLTKFVLKLNNTNLSDIVNEVEERSYMKTVVINIF